VPNLSPTYAYTNALQAFTREALVSDVIVDQVFTAAKLLQYLMDGKMLDRVRGGAALTWNTNVGRSPNTIAFDGDDPLPINSMSANIQRAGVGWKNYSDALVLAITDIAQNEGSKEQIASLVEAQLDITRMSLADKIAGDLFTNTQFLNPKQIDGLAAAVDNGTQAPQYANLNRNTLGTLWQSPANYQVASTANLLQTIYLLDLQASVDAQRPDFYVTNRGVFGALQISLFAQDHYYQPEMARAAGGNDLIFNGNPVFIDNHCPTGVATPATFSIAGSNSFGAIYGLNSSFIKFVINPALDFSTSDWIASQTNATLFCRIFAELNLTVTKPGSCWVAYIQNQ
jgi:hypothetical protein